ncbi:DDE-1 domain-containing protein [Nephila pilipes]|uniref:DDE-1 domain-containing protein n=1 Tax=Nephila pilipes TaxID=299642 RepID=A0A8X6R5M7_NEPPI|nr:DDE-1 domain-containing protein [Nephila pilipes]
MPNINLRENISEISKAENYEVTDGTIHKSFAKAGFCVCSESSDSTEDEDDIPLEETKKIWIQLKEKQEITDSVLLDDFLFLDSKAETSGSLTESDILNSVTNKNSTAMDCSEDEDENKNDDNAEINIPSYDEMINSFEAIRHGLQCEENSLKGFLMHCKDVKCIMKQSIFSNKINRFSE